MDKYIQEQEINECPSKKLPVIFLVDLSGSMTTTEYRQDGKSLINQVVNRITDFIDAMKEDPDTAACCQVAILGFNDNTRVIDEFSLAKNKNINPNDFIAEGRTYIVPALNLSLNMLHEQKQFLYDNGIKYYQPWLILLTDGLAMDPDSEISNIKETLKNEQNNQKLVVYSLALADDEELYNQIRGYSIYKPIKDDVNGERLHEFFKFLKQSCRSFSKGKGNTVVHFTDYDALQ